ncbi:hypothetical protein KGQ19_05015 [Catenulispora sp. NL8]|uniref:Uncharacterized protein n=1 Tax=Catenulispora pinistramenti TaxID=2705254 RepID=A0ABS5KIS2_9ACTN|nr:hypothetical protein [Catenulispora pinistramenti]MBS2546224.1 hypothetical protein [Catenulispora pinistramenti]
METAIAEELLPANAVWTLLADGVFRLEWGTVSIRIQERELYLPTRGPSRRLRRDPTHPDGAA